MYKRFNDLASWQKAGMKRCSCGGLTVLFYDEAERYRVECVDCNKVTRFHADSRVRAKEKWNNWYGRSFGEWIPIKERWPSKSGAYLTTYREWSDGNYLPKYDDTYIRILRYHEAIFELPVCISRRAEADIHREVIAWMPLPEIYREGKE